MVLSSIFYLIIIAVIGVAVWMFIHNRRRLEHSNVFRGKIDNIPKISAAKDDESSDSSSSLLEESSLFDPNLIVLRINSFLGKPYMGYELHQALLASGLRFGDGNLFHRYSELDRGKLLFSLAAATPTGEFNLEDMGSFKCNALLLFMQLDTRKKLMDRFDLMLDTARQLAEELGGDICDDLLQPINLEVIKRLREKICQVETTHPYASDLLDNLD